MTSSEVCSSHQLLSVQSWGVLRMSSTALGTLQGPQRHQPARGDPLLAAVTSRVSERSVPSPGERFASSLHPKVSFCEESREKLTGIYLILSNPDQNSLVMKRNGGKRGGEEQQG